jgi:hypothetical protein
MAGGAPLIIAIGYETDWNNRIYTHHDGIYIRTLGWAEAKLSLSRKPKEDAMDSDRKTLSTPACATLFPLAGTASPICRMARCRWSTSSSSRN